MGLNSKNFDFKMYKKTYSRSTLLMTISIFSVALLLYPPIKENILNYLVDNYASDVQSTLLVTILFTFLLVIVLYSTIVKLCQQLIPTINSIIVLSAFTIGYLIVRNDEHYTFYSVPYIVTIRLADIIFCTIALNFIPNYQSFRKKLSISDSYLIEDTADNVEDAFSRLGFAEKIANAIKGSSAVHNSFAICIVGDWGSGKTFLLNKLAELLKANQENEVIEFNPWKTKQTPNIIEDFFKVLGGRLKKYNQSSDKLVKDYANQLFGNSKNVWLKSIAVFLNNSAPQSIASLHDEINQAINSSGKRFVVFIDDIDRLTANEILETFRLIRNTANFSNVFYIVALDESYVVETIKKLNVIHHEEMYLRKIFQLVVSLPAQPKDVIADKLKEYLKLEYRSLVDKKKIEEIIGSFSTRYVSMREFMNTRGSSSLYIDEILKNIRDVKRFCNSFNMIYDLVGDNVEVFDLFVLELIRQSNYEVYNSLSNRKLLKYGNGVFDEYVLDEDNWNKLFNDKENDNPNLSNTKELVRLLLKSNNKSYRRMSNSNSFYLYFSYQLFSLISLTEFNNTLEKHDQEIIKQLKKWEEERKGKDLRDIFNTYSDFKDAKFFEKIIRTLLTHAASDKYYFFAARSFIYNIEIVNRLFTTHSNDISYKEFLIRIFTNKDINEIFRAEIANELLKQYIYRESNPLFSDIIKQFTKVELQEIIYTLFDEYLTKSETYNEEVFSFYMLNDDNRDSNRRIGLNTKASNRLKEFILSNEQRKQDFIIRFIRPRSTPHDGSFAFMPFATDIFGGISPFKEFVKSVNNISSDEGFGTLKSIILSYFDIVYSASIPSSFIPSVSENEFLIKFCKDYDIPIEIR